MPKRREARRVSGKGTTQRCSFWKLGTSAIAASLLFASLHGSTAQVMSLPGDFTVKWRGGLQDSDCLR
jgi:hypothetical protein